MSRRLEELKKALEGFGEVNLMALEEYQELKRRHDFLTEQQADLHTGPGYPEKGDHPDQPDDDQALPGNLPSGQ